MALPSVQAPVSFLSCRGAESQPAAQAQRTCPSRRAWLRAGWPAGHLGQPAGRCTGHQHYYTTYSCMACMHGSKTDATSKAVACKPLAPLLPGLRALAAKVPNTLWVSYRRAPLVWCDSRDTLPSPSRALPAFLDHERAGSCSSKGAVNCKQQARLAAQTQRRPCVQLC